MESLVLEVGEEVSLFSVLGVLEVELGGVGLEVCKALGLEFISLGELV